MAQGDGFIEALCGQDVYLTWIFLAALVLLVLQIPYLLFADPESAVFVAVVMNTVGFSAFLIASGAALGYCRKRY